MMRKVSNSVFPAYDRNDPMILDEVAMAKAFRDAIAHGERFLGVLLSDGRIVFVDVNRKTLGDVFEMKQGSMYAEGVGAIRCAHGNDQESITRALSGRVIIPERCSFRQVAHSL